MTSASPPSSRIRGIVALMAACLSSLMFGLEISSVPAILPTLEKVLHADFSALQWIMNAYTIAVTTVLMAAGTLADRYGRKRVFLIGIAAFGLTSLIAGLAQDVSLLIVARFLQGMSGGVMLICQVAVLSHQFPDRPRLWPDHRRCDRSSRRLAMGLPHPCRAGSRDGGPCRNGR
jgi:MFS family permease